MVKFCILCNQPLIGKARKYCNKCKPVVHKEQMHKFYCENTKNWQYGGLYWNQQKHNKFGTGSLGGKSTLNWDKEQSQIDKEFKNLGLRIKNNFWRT